MARRGELRSIAVVLLVACGGSDPVSVCLPEGPDDNVWPAGCDTFDCHDQVCDVTCPAGSSCPRLDCTTSPHCRIDCQMNVACANIDCTGAADCFVDCEENSACELTCSGAGLCSENCRPSSQCLLRCGAAGSGSCVMDMCPAPVDCGGGVIVCNRACP